MANLLRYLSSFVQDEYVREDFEADRVAAVTKIDPDLSGEDVLEMVELVRLQVDPDLADRIDPDGPAAPPPPLVPELGETPVDVAIRCIDWLAHAVEGRPYELPERPPIPFTIGAAPNDAVEPDSAGHPLEQPLEPTAHDETASTAAVIDELVIPEPAADSEATDSDDFAVDQGDRDDAHLIEWTPEPVDEHPLHAPHLEWNDGDDDSGDPDDSFTAHIDWADGATAALPIGDDDADVPVPVGDADTSSPGDSAAITETSFATSGGSGLKLPFIGDSGDTDEPPPWTSDDADRPTGLPFSSDASDSAQLPWLIDEPGASDLPWSLDDDDAEPSTDDGEFDDTPDTAADEPQPAATAAPPTAGTDPEEPAFQSLDMVRVTEPIGGTDVEAGAMATIVAVHLEPHVHYEIEVNDNTGRRLYLGVVRPHQLAPFDA